MIGLSGGVDSAVAAYLLKCDGYQVSALFMKNWDEDDQNGQCSAEADLQDATQVAATLKIPLHSRNFSSEYWQQVFAHFLAEYQAGRTPNPDVLCNREIKFTTFLEHALALGADAIGTGHYARIRHQGGHYQLLKAQDDNKDQSYFLHLLNQTQLARVLFPLGELAKTKVRAMAEQQGFANFGKKDSTGICFIGERHFKEFLSRYLPAQPGEIQTEDGKVVGKHDGVMYYTLGQRQGLGIGGSIGSNGQPWYVLGKNLEQNLLIVGQGPQHALLYQQALIAETPHWIGETPPVSFRCQAKTRYRQPDQACWVKHWDHQSIVVEFDSPQRAITPGQSVVFYQGEVCLGGAVIAKSYHLEV